MAEVNEGVQIILNRMETNPEEFFGDGQRWNWIFKETLREVMTEQEKAALHAGLCKVRRLEITAKAAATVLRADEINEPNVKLADPWATGAQAPVMSRFTTEQNNGTSASLIPPKKRSLKDLL